MREGNIFAPIVEGLRPSDHRPTVIANVSGTAREKSRLGRRSYAAFGNSTGDREMLEYTGAGAGARLMMLVLHDDADVDTHMGRHKALPETKVGTFSQELYDEAKKKNWTVISKERLEARMCLRKGLMSGFVTGDGEQEYVSHQETS